MNNRFVTACCFFIFTIFSYLTIIAPVYADEQTQTENSADMVVTGTRIDDQAIDIPVPTQIISSEEIELSGLTNLGDILGKFVTGHLHKYSGLLTSAGIRGFRTDSHGDDIKGHVLILVDGHRMGTGNIAKISSDRIERIEVIKGPASALYGSAAMGGVINIITKRGGEELKATVKGEIGSFYYDKESVTLEGEFLENKLGFHISGSSMSTGDYSVPEFGTAWNTQEKHRNYGGNLTFSPNEQHHFRLGGNYADLTGEYLRWNFYTTYSEYDRDYKGNYDKSHRYIDFEYDGSFLDDRLSAQTLLYYLRDKNQWNSGSPDPDSRVTRYIDKTFGIDQQLSYKFGDWNTLLAGFTIEDMEKESAGWVDYQPSLPYTPAMEYDTKSFFIQDKLDLFDNRVNILLAARYDRFEVETKHPDTGELENNLERTETYSRWSPKGGIGVKFFDELLRIRLNAGSGFKSPSADQLSAYYEKNSDPAANNRFLGNPDLDPEESVTYEAGFDIYHDQFELNTSVFHTDYRDKIVRTETTFDGKEWTTYENIGKADIEGVDVGLKWRINRTLNFDPELVFRTNVVYNTRYKEKDPPREYLQYISHYEYKSGLDLKYNELSAGISHVLIGPQYITNYDVYPYAIERKDSFSFWDLYVSYRFMENLTISCNVYNVFDQQYEWVRGYIMPERSLKLSLTYTF